MFITLEGIEGSGKTTQVKHLIDYCKSKGYDCIATREPGGTAIGKKIRTILLDPASRDMNFLTELLLYNADRAQHVNQIISPALAEGKIVICDRYYDATVVYQGFARGLDTNLINRLHNLIFSGLKPDITFLFDLPAEKGLSRAWRQIKSGSRNGMEVRFENEKVDFHKKVRAGYLELARLEPERFRLIDATESVEQVGSKIIKILSGELVNHKSC